MEGIAYYGYGGIIILKVSRCVQQNYFGFLF